MEKRIKILYIITIMAIFAFLGIQIYWLYNRYEYALNEFRDNLEDRIAGCVDDYNVIRRNSSPNWPGRLQKKGKNIMTIPRFSLEQTYGDSVTAKRTARIYTYHFSAQELLGLEPGTPLTREQKNRAIELADKHMNMAADPMVFDASGARDENEAWTATQNVQTQRNHPFTCTGIDSLLKKEGIEARTELTEADSMVWRRRVSFYNSIFSPDLSMTIPYSQLEGLAVTIVCPINPLDVLPGMMQPLVVTLLVSALLIICLILQISTVLRLSRIDKMRNSFVTTMIHELKRPVSTLKMCVSGLTNVRMMGDKAIREELIGETRTALDSLSAYFSKLRDITFNNVEQIPLNIQRVSLHELFDAIAEATVVPSDKKVIFHNDIDGELQVSADRSHLYNMIYNLVENAVKYSGPSVEIRAAAVRVNESVVIHVSDTGNGISAGDVRHIFNRFFRGKASAGEQPGMGLGLAYVRLLAEAHGGDVSVRSAVGEGSCFTVTLPQ